MPESTPTGSSRRHLALPLGIAALTSALDQVVKLVVSARFGPEAGTHRRELPGDLLAIEYAENRGIAFGLLQGQTVLVSLAAIIVVVVSVRRYRQMRRVPAAVALSVGLIVGGAIGNLLDRVRLGYVVDFISVSIWPNFNIADAAITLGVLLMVWRYPHEAGQPRADPSVRAHLA